MADVNTAENRTHTLRTERHQCQMCDKPITTKTQAGKAKLYCSSACKQAAYRQSKGADVGHRQTGQRVGNERVQHGDIPICALDGCDLPAQQGKRNRLYKMYCSNAHKQKAKRQRRLGTLKSSANRTQTLPTMPDLFYLRKGKGVVHMGVKRNVTFCGRDADEMEEVSNEGVQKYCQRCKQTRDDKSWWQGWRQAFGDGSTG